MNKKAFTLKLKQLQRQHRTLLTRRNLPQRLGNGLFDRYERPVLTAEHVPLEWRYDFNHRRPHSSIGDLTPKEFAARHRKAPSPSGSVDRLKAVSVKGEGALDPAVPQPLKLRGEGEGAAGEAQLREGVP